MGTLYKDVDNDKHGGKYNAIMNLPIHLSTNAQLTTDSNEKGLGFTKNSMIECIIDPLVNLKPSDGDLLTFTNGLYQHGVYRVTNIDYSSTLHTPYTKLTIELVPNTTPQRMKQFVLTELGFIDNYHFIFEKGDAFMIVALQQCIDNFISYFNDIYDHTMDAHIDNDKRVFVDFEMAFNKLISKNQPHLMMTKIHRSYLPDNLLSYYSDRNSFEAMLNVSNSVDNILLFDYENACYTSKISRLDKTRRRSINNRVKVYRLINPNNESDAKLVLNNDSSLADLELPLNTIEDWNLLFHNKDFMNDVKDQLSTFIKTKLQVTPTDMFTNAIRLAQTFYILDEFVKSRLAKSTVDNFSSIRTT